MKFTAKFLQAPQSSPTRHGDNLNFHAAGISRLAQAGLSRLLRQSDTRLDFVILTSYNHGVSEKENARVFQGLPNEFRRLVGTKRIGAYELIGHWIEHEEGVRPRQELERSWFFIKNSDSKLSSEDFFEGAQLLALKYNQSAFICRRGGKTTLVTPSGEVWATLTNDGAIQSTLGKLMKTSGELLQLRAKGRDGFFEGTPKEVGEIAKISESEERFRIYVGVPANDSDRMFFSDLGWDDPGWTDNSSLADYDKPLSPTMASARAGKPLNGIRSF